MRPNPLFARDERHYSYAAYADPAMAATFDAKRFGGPIGQILLADQERVLAEFLGDVRGWRVLDMGTGTGRAALSLARLGAHVTGVDASPDMLNVARARAAQEGLAIDFAEGDVHRLAFTDRAFDAVVCLRVLMHVPDWREAIGELCRVSGNRLVFDYPAVASAAAIQSAWRRLAVGLGRRVEAYRVFRSSDISRELDRNGFCVRSIHKQFVLPIAVHKGIGSPGFTRRVERVLEGAGLCSLAGSPVTVAAERCAF